MSDEFSEIPIYVTEVDDAPGRKSVLGKRGRTVLKSIPVDALRESLRRLSHSLADVFAEVRAVGDFELHEVKVQVEVSASGGVQLIGTAKAAGKGALTLTFRPPSDAP